MMSNLLAADFTILQWIPGFKEWDASVSHELGNTIINNEQVHSVAHLVFAAIATLIIVAFVTLTRLNWSGDDDAVVPQGSFSVRNFMEGILDACLNYGEMILGSKKNARRFLPLIGTLAIFIFINNIIGLFPFFTQATGNLNMTIAPAVVVFIVTHVVGIKEQGMHYLEHFLGPKIGGFWWLFPLFIPLEIISHVARPVSLALRLMGNMVGDHAILGVFLGFGVISIFFVPLPFYALGTIVCTVQTLVFCLLSLVYIALSLEHSEEGH